VQLEHYEKIEGVPLSLDGKANQLAGMVKANLGAALQGFVVVPLFAGYDTDAAEPAKAGRIVTFDATGGRYEERMGHHAVGSGSVFARGALKKLYTDGMTAQDAITMTMHALYDAADDDSATGGPDLTRQIWPLVATVTAEGFRQLTEEEAAGYARGVINERMQSPGGPIAPLRPAGPGG
jgi:proteasome beta subunit